MLNVYYHPGFYAPIGQHIMPMEKFALVARELKSFSNIQLCEPEPVSLEQLLSVHSPEYVDAVRTGEPRALAESQKFPWSPELFPSVCLTSGGCLAAARQALKEEVSAALVSGFHHSCHNHGEGFCTFNGLIITADTLLHSGEAKKIAVLDMDLHYGNGTAQLAANRPHVFAVSIYGNDYWANAAFREVTIRRHQDGPNHISFALPAACNGQTLRQTMEEVLPLIAAWEPDILLYQAGADPFYEDPYSPLALDFDDLMDRDRTVFEFAESTGIPIAWVLAGGYTKDISKIVRVHTNTFLAAQAVFE